MFSIPWSASAGPSTVVKEDGINPLILLRDVINQTYPLTVAAAVCVYNNCRAHQYLPCTYSYSSFLVLCVILLQSWDCSLATVENCICVLATTATSSFLCKETTATYIISFIF